MLKKDRDLRMFGLASDQRLADAFAGRQSHTTSGAEMANRALRDGSFAVTPRQSWRGTGFAPRGRGNRGRQAANRGRIQGQSSTRGGRNQAVPQLMGGRNQQVGRGQRQVQQGGNQRDGCYVCGQHGHFARECPNRATARMLTNQYAAGEEQQFKLHGVFMLSQQSSISFPFGDRKALVSIDSNCSRHMTGFYSLINTKPCSVLVDGAFESGEPSRATHQGDLQLGQLYFSDMAFVPGLRETILSLGQLDKEGCTTKISGGRLEVYSPSGLFLFSAFLHAGRYFLDSSHYYGPTIQRTDTAMMLRDASYDNSAKLWHCRMGHVNWPGLKNLQQVSTGIALAPKHKLSFCACCVMAKLKQTPYQNLGVKRTRPREVFGADVTRPYPKSPGGFQYCLEVVCFFSGFGYSFPLRLKSEAARQFMGLILRLENAELYPNRIQCYVSDHGGILSCLDFNSSWATEAFIGRQHREVPRITIL